MTLHDAAKQALDVLQGIIDLEEMPYDPFATRDVAYQHFKAIQDLRDALAEPDGWRQCAVGQRTTQYCGLLEEAVEAAKDEAYSRGIDAGWALAQQSKAVQERNSGYTEEYATNVAAYARREEREAIWNFIFEYAGRDDLSDSDQSLLKYIADAIRARGNDEL